MIAIFYQRPGNLLRTFVVIRPESRINLKGREVREFGDGDIDDRIPWGAKTIRAVLAEATPQEKAQWEQIRHPITHTIVSNGRPKAGTGDMLAHGTRRFLVQGVDDPGELGLATIYYAEERTDV